MVSIASLEESAVGLTWIVDEPAARISHALIDGGRVWLIDPTDEPVTLERLAALGKPAAVLQLIDRHNRGCAALADRLGVPHLKAPAALPGTPFEVIPLVSARFWQEVWWAEPRALVVAKAIGRRRALRRAAWEPVYISGCGCQDEQPELLVDRGGLRRHAEQVVGKKACGFCRQTPMAAGSRTPRCRR